MTAELLASRPEETDGEYIERVTKFVASTGQTVRLFNLNWSMGEYRTLAEKLEPVTSWSSPSPRSELPGSDRHGHIHFAEAPAYLPEAEKESFPHKVKFTTFTTSAETVFMHELDFGDDRKFYIFGPLDLKPLDLIAI